MNITGHSCERFAKSTPTATVFVIDDDAGIRRSFALLLRSVGLDVETFTSADEFLTQYDIRRPGCLILDVRMPGMSGLELQKQLNQRGIRLPVIFISAHGEIPMVVQVLRAGALDFFQKPYSPQAMVERIQDAIERDDSNRQAIVNRNEVASRFALLSVREQQVMRMLASGLSTKAIGSQLDISSKTVDNHRARIFEKVQIDNAAQLATLVLKLGLADDVNDNRTTRQSAVSKLECNRSLKQGPKELM